jgi:phage shock protein PspC (stress-responsive transcriptional regulator)
MSTDVKKLYRSQDERMIAGVCGGLGEFLGIDPTIIRLIFVVATIWGGAGAIVYLIMLLVVPDETLGPSETPAASILDKAVDSVSNKDKVKEPTDETEPEGEAPDTEEA